MPSFSSSKSRVTKSYLSKHKALHTRISTAVLALGGVAAAFAQGQSIQPEMNLTVKPRGAITVPCCRCIDGKTQTIDISTGIAPWTSPNGSVGAIPRESAWADKPPAKWVNTGSTTAGNYTYQLRINVPKNCIVPMDVSFKGIVYGDNNVVVKLGDRQIGTTAVSSTGQANYGFRDPYGVPIAGSLGPGNHVLSVTVRNDEGPTGLLVNGTLTVKCSSGPLTQGGKSITDVAQ
jgi:hypothetical protein